MLKIHYIAQFGSNSIGRILSYSPAGQSKMNYIIDVLVESGVRVEVFSTCGAKEPSFYNCQRISTNDMVDVRFCSTFGSRSKYLKLVDIFYRQIQLFIYLLIAVKHREIVLIYHERFYLPVISFIKKIKKIRLIYEVEEIYSIVAGYSPEKIGKEISRLEIADSYIFSNDLMAKQFDIKDRDYIVCYGAYRRLLSAFSPKYDDRTHIVYAGTFAKHKGVEIAIGIAKYLSNEFHIHILGFGSDSDINYTMSLIQATQLVSEAKITYEGLLLGSELTFFLGKCQIGLSPQDSNNSYNSTSFPSKILTYLLHDLVVITTPIEVLKESKLNNHLFYSEDNTSQSMAKKILEVEINKNVHYSKFVSEMDAKFKDDLNKVIGALN